MPDATGPDTESVAIADIIAAMEERVTRERDALLAVSREVLDTIENYGSSVAFIRCKKLLREVIAKCDQPKPNGEPCPTATDHRPN